jgi:hypothetical protein
MLTLAENKLVLDFQLSFASIHLKKIFYFKLFRLGKLNVLNFFWKSSGRSFASGNNFNASDFCGIVFVFISTFALGSFAGGWLF